jgi:hypothetical protein
MTDEAEQTGEESGELDPLAEMQQMLDSAPEVEEPEVEETAQAEGDDDSAEGDPVETEPAEVAEEVADEGPSFLMKRAAVEAGIDPALVGRAKDDDQLALMIEAASRPEPKDVAPAKDRTLKLELPEEEFGPDDPVRKVFESLQQQFNEQLEERDKALAALTTFANSQLDREDQQQWQALYEPFDKALDSFESPLLGTSGKLSDKQRAERALIAEKYVALGATTDMSAEEKARYAELATAAVRKDLVDQRNKKQQAATRQARQVTGGGGPQRTVQRVKTKDDLLSEWDKSLRNGTPLPN